MKAFISYSHKDAVYLDRLHAHLATLRREGGISTWYDREILAGGMLDSEIIGQLKDSDLFLALVSPDFLSSNYCYEKEMGMALQLHETGSIRIVPIIVEPCDWHSTPLGKFKAIPKDGRPVAEWQNQNTAFLDIVTELRHIVMAGKPLNSPPLAMPAPTTIDKSAESRYRVKRHFDEIDRQDFRQRIYKEIHDYIEAAIKEINSIEDIKARFSDITSSSFTCSILNKALQNRVGHITVHAGRGFGGDISYSFSENASANISNGGFSIEADDYELFLINRSFMMRSNDNERVTEQQAAKILWNALLEQAGVSHA